MLPASTHPFPRSFPATLPQTTPYVPSSSTASMTRAALLRMSLPLRYAQLHGVVAHGLDGLRQDPCSLIPARHKVAGAPAMCCGNIHHYIMPIHSASRQDAARHDSIWAHLAGLNAWLCIAELHLYMSTFQPSFLRKALLSSGHQASTSKLVSE